MALTNEGYETPTPIQAQAIPSAMAGRDVLGIAQTGTGKTAAFSLPILNHLATHKQRPNPKSCRVLVLCPTRELASQIAQSMKTYGAHLHLHIATVFGGVPYGAQIRALTKGVDVLVATPGRLVDHLESHNVNLGDTEVLVLDEVDQMLDLGFVKAIKRLTRLLPAHRQNLFFSATMPKEIGELAAELLRDPVRVSVAPVATTAERVEQMAFFIEQRRKQDLLVELFADPALVRSIVFTRTKRGADKVTMHMEKAGIPSAAIHGNKSQNQRERSLQDFRQGRVRALVATDIAARGIDIDGVTHVINFDLPEVAEAYVHRIGRTARAGAEGRAISLVDGEERGLLRNIEKLTRQQLPVEDRRDPHAQSTSPAIVQPDRRGGKGSSGGGRAPGGGEGRNYAGQRERNYGEQREQRTGDGRRPQRAASDRPSGDRPVTERSPSERNFQGDARSAERASQAERSESRPERSEYRPERAGESNRSSSSRPANTNSRSSHNGGGHSGAGRSPDGASGFANDFAGSTTRKRPGSPSAGRPTGNAAAPARPRPQGDARPSRPQGEGGQQRNAQGQNRQGGRRQG